MESWICGPHLLEFEPPDVFHCRVRAVVAEEEARETVRIAAEEICAKRGLRVFFLVHLEGMTSGARGPFTSGARKYLGSTMYDWKGIVVVGGSTVVRVAASVLARAYSLLKPLTVPTIMVKNMEEARKFMDGIRAKETAAPPGPSAVKQAQ